MTRPSEKLTPRSLSRLILACPHEGVGRGGGRAHSLSRTYNDARAHGFLFRSHSRRYMQIAMSARARTCARARIVCVARTVLIPAGIRLGLIPAEPDVAVSAATSGPAAWARSPQALSQPRGKE